MKLTKNYILTRDETSETGLSVHKRHTYEYVGVIGAPFEGEWGWDYEIEGTDSLTKAQMLKKRSQFVSIGKSPPKNRFLGGIFSYYRMGPFADSSSRFVSISL